MANKKETTSVQSTQDRRKIIQDRLKGLGIHSTSLKMGNDFVPNKFLPTGIVEVDTILGDVPGIAVGSLVEVCGEHQSGKSYLTLRTIAEAQKQGLRCALLNIEQSFYEPRAIAIGVQVRNEDLFEMYDCIPTAEIYCNLLEELVRSGEYGVIVVDSITALIPEVDYNKDFTENPKFAAHASLVGRLMKKLLTLCAQSDTTVILINQFRTGSGAIPNTFTKKPGGGNAVEYFTHYRLWTERVNGANGHVIGEDGAIIGGKSSMFVQKTRFGIPYQKAVYPIYFKDAKVDPLGEFLYRASSRGKEYVTINRKIYQYVDKDSGEIYCKDKDPVEFVKRLLNAPPIRNLTKGDTSTTGFEYIANRLKLTEDQKQEIIDSLSKEHNIDAPLDTAAIELSEVHENESVTPDP